MDLQRLLKSACHAPGCETISRCPHICNCRSKRTFKTNNETAMCWELSNQILGYLRRKPKTVRQKRKIESFASAYMILAKYHMTKGWENFYWRAYTIIRMVFNPTEYIHSTPSETSIVFLKEMRIAINRLKREAKG